MSTIIEAIIDVIDITNQSRSKRCIEGMVKETSQEAAKRIRADLQLTFGVDCFHRTPNTNTRYHCYHDNFLSFAFELFYEEQAGIRNLIHQCKSRL